FYAPALTVQIQGNGTVTSSPGTGINCSSGTCSSLFVQGAVVTLNANPSAVSWSGDCVSGGGRASGAMAVGKSCAATVVATNIPPPPTCTPPCMVSFGSYFLLVQWSPVFNNSGTFNSYVEVTWCNTGTLSPPQLSSGSTFYSCRVSPSGIPFSLQP